MTDAKKTAAPVKRAAKIQPATEVAAVAGAVAKPSKPAPRAAKAAAPKAKAKLAKPAYTHDDIALRAYFIAERRHAKGIHGEPHKDWVEAERQLKAEATKARKAKKS